MYKEGFTDAKVATVLGVHESTINNWKIRDPKFFESIQDWKRPADLKVVESLYKSATGYTSYDYKVVPGPQGMGSNLKRVDKEIPPNFNAINKWLNNRMPDEWREKNSIEFDFTNAPTELLADLARKALGKLDEIKTEGDE